MRISAIVLHRPILPRRHTGITRTNSGRNAGGAVTCNTRIPTRLYAVHCSPAYAVCMCRSIKTLRPPYEDHATEDDMRAAALQYVRKISGMRSPSRVNSEAFDAAVEAVTGATHELLHALQLRTPARSTDDSPR
jgi:hypothetical protein